jgi:spoIIIJ-associated protein
MNDKIEASGKTVDDAVNEALLRLGARRDEVDVTVLDEPKSGFLGILGGRPAKVEVTRKRSSRRGQRRSNKDQQAHEFGGKQQSGQSRRGGKSGGRGGSGPRKDTPPKAARVSSDEPKASAGKNQRSDDKKQGRDSERGSQTRRPRQQKPSGQDNRRSRNQGRPAAGKQEAAPQENVNGGDNQQQRQPRQERKPRNDRRPRNNRQNQADRQVQPDQSVAQPIEQSAPVQNESQPRKERAPRQDRPARQDRPERSENREPRAARVQNTAPDEIIATGISAGKYAKPVREIPMEELNDNLEKMTMGLLVRAGFPTRCEVKDGEYQQVRVTTDDESAGMLIGRHGATIDSVEHLIERMISMGVGDRVKMNLDINNYRHRRHESLLERVQEAVAHVRETGKTYHVEPLNARERRIIHLAVEEYDGLRTFTMDSHRGRHVIIALENEDKDKSPETSETPETDSIEVEIVVEESGEVEPPEEERPLD